MGAIGWVCVAVPLNIIGIMVVSAVMRKIDRPAGTTLRRVRADHFCRPPDAHEFPLPGDWKISGDRWVEDDEWRCWCGLGWRVYRPYMGLWLLWDRARDLDSPTEPRPSVGGSEVTP